MLSMVGKSELEKLLQELYFLVYFLIWNWQISIGSILQEPLYHPCSNQFLFHVLELPFHILKPMLEFGVQVDHIPKRAKQRENFSDFYFTYINNFLSVSSVVLKSKISIENRVLQCFWPKSVYLKCFGIQLKTVYLQGPHSSRQCISSPCCT